MNAEKGKDVNYSPVYSTFQIITECWEGKSSVLGVMGSVNVGAQVGAGEPFSAFRGGFVPMKTAVEVTVGEPEI